MPLQRSRRGCDRGAAGLAGSQIVLFNKMSAHGVPVVPLIADIVRPFIVNTALPGDHNAEDEGGGQAVMGGAVEALQAPGGGEADGADTSWLVEIQETGPALPGDHSHNYNGEDPNSRYGLQCGRRWKEVDKNKKQNTELNAQNKQLIKDLEASQAEAKAANAQNEQLIKDLEASQAEEKAMKEPLVVNILRPAMSNSHVRCFAKATCQIQAEAKAEVKAVKEPLVANIVGPV